MNLKPIADRVILKSLDMEEKTTSGIILTPSNNEKPSMAEVIAVGNGTDNVKMEVKVGDKVIYSKYAATDIVLDDEKYLIINHNEILAVIEG